MNSGIAIYYEGITIYWSSIFIVLGILSGTLIGLALYGWREKYVWTYTLYLPFAIMLSLALSRFLYWAGDNSSSQITASASVSHIKS